jgi:diadenosine tetraphosphatase ApaH/serine/threonine PP2A family protein phosphatase
VNGFTILHGSPVDEDEYLVTELDAAQAVPYLEAPVTFFGHTHLQGGFMCHRNGVRRIPQAAGSREEMALDNDAYYLVNPGSVGQPRDGDPRAAYVLYESDEHLVTYCRVPYDVRSAQRKIRKAGLPDILAERLAVGN